MERAGGNSRVSRDLVNKRIKIEVDFRNEDQQPNQAAEKNEGKVELRLGLSMNGRFGVDISSAENFKRSYSVSNLHENAAGTIARVVGGASGVHAPLPRASSLPAADIEERLGGFRRPGKDQAAAARKQRMEKMKKVRVVKAVNGGSGLHGGEKRGVGMKFPDNEGVVNGSGNLMLVQSPEGPIGSHMGSSSAGSHVPQGPALTRANTFSTMRRCPLCDRIPNDDEHSVPRFAITVDIGRSNRRRMLENAMLEMPQVSTMGEGVDRIKGILYKYARVDELEIVCACHGFFLSPSEFVRHGGGGDVAQPLRHIIVIDSRPVFQV